MNGVAASGIVKGATICYGGHVFSQNNGDMDPTKVTI
jgi:hypothetical protein